MAETTDHAHELAVSSYFDAGVAIGKQLGSGSEEAAHQAYDKLIAQIQPDNKSAEEFTLAAQQGMHQSNPRDVQPITDGYFIDWNTEKAVTYALNATEPVCRKLFDGAQSYNRLEEQVITGEPGKLTVQMQAVANDINGSLETARHLSTHINETMPTRIDGLAYQTFVDDFRSRRQCPYFGAVVDTEYLTAKILPPQLAQQQPPRFALGRQVEMDPRASRE
jgi:hypothetical protein